MDDEVWLWQRLEPQNRDPDLRRSLRAPVADPLWMLARQARFGEVQGFDGGSAVRVTHALESLPMELYQGGLAGPGPLEQLVEGVESGEAALDERSRTAWGQALLRDIRRALGSGGLAEDIGRILTSEPHVFQRGSDAPSPSARTGAVVSSIEGEVPDALAVRQSWQSAQEDLDPWLDALGLDSSRPSRVDRQKLAAALSSWHERLSATLQDLEGGPARGQLADNQGWDEERLSYGRLEATVIDDGARATLRSPDHRGGQLPWYAFDLDAQNLSGAGAAASEVTSLPGILTYSGMPRDRFWALEDGAVSFPGVETSTVDLPRRWMLDFALRYGDDWKLLALDVPVGHLVRLSRLDVTDSFGETVSADPASASLEGFSLFELTPRGQTDAAGWFYAAPRPGALQEGGPLDQVTLGIDELANVVWAIEEQVDSGWAIAIDREDVWRRRKDSTATPEVPDADILSYRLMEGAPDPWFPLVPPTGQSDDGFLYLRRLWRPEGEQPDPQGELLSTTATPGKTHRLHREEAQQAGVTLHTTWVHTRWTDGRSIFWRGKRQRVGHGPLASGLGWDLILGMTDGPA